MKITDVKQARAFLKSAKKICVLTGAGISQESGVPTFRDARGLWEKYRIEEVASPEGFAEDPARTWRFYNARRKAANIATPNAAHLSLARLELGRLRKVKSVAKPRYDDPTPFVLITQNVDGLHQQAGSQNVVELHGSIWKVRCPGCGDISSDYPIELPLPPRCTQCRSLVRPHVVWFGEMLEPEILIAAEHHVRQCDVLLVIGTSAVVQPAASFPLAASQRGIPVIEVNMERTMISDIATVSLQGKAGQIVPELLTGE